MWNRKRKKSAPDHKIINNESITLWRVKICKLKNVWLYTIYPRQVKLCFAVALFPSLYIISAYFECVWEWNVAHTLYMHSLFVYVCECAHIISLFRHMAANLDSISNCYGYQTTFMDIQIVQEGFLSLSHSISIWIYITLLFYC